MTEQPFCPGEGWHPTEIDVDAEVGWEFGDATEFLTDLLTAIGQAMLPYGVVFGWSDLQADEEPFTLRIGERTVTLLPGEYEEPAPLTACMRALIAAGETAREAGNARRWWFLPTSDGFGQAYFLLPQEAETLARAAAPFRLFRPHDLISH